VKRFGDVLWYYGIPAWLIVDAGISLYGHARDGVFLEPRAWSVTQFVAALGVLVLFGLLIRLGASRYARWVLPTFAAILIFEQFAKGVVVDSAGVLYGVILFYATPGPHQRLRKKRKFNWNRRSKPAVDIDRVWR
jgi:hypothetical protein